MRRLAARLAGLLCALALGWSSAQGLSDFLAPLAAHPAARSAAAGVAAAQAQLRGAREPFALSLTGGLSVFDNEEVDLAPELPGQQGLPASAGQLTAELTLKPFPLPEVLEQGEINLAQAQLEYRDTLAGLEAQALSAALQLQLAQTSLELAREGEALSREALSATRLRAERGAATAREVREAEAGLAEARNLVADAEGGLELARLALRQLLPEGGTLDVAALQLPMPEGTPLSVARAELGVAGARLSEGVAGKALVPIVQAGYSWNLDAGSTVGVSLESRTLQPRVSYSYQDPGRGPPQSYVNGSFQVGVTMRFSSADVEAAEAARAQLEAARAGLEAARGAAELQRRSLQSDAEQAQRALELAQLRFENAREALAEAQRREELGLGVPLETQQAALEQARRGLELQQARQRAFSSALELYRFYALPLTEVLP